MTKTKLNEFRKTLENKQAELGNRNREALDIETSADALDRIQHASERDYAMSSLERSCSLLREVRVALRQMDAGTFGICAGCEEDINPKRLAAIPWASSCIVCQEAVERGLRLPHYGLDTQLVMAA